MTMHFIISYGILLHETSRAGIIHYHRKFRPVRVYGWRRVFNLVCEEDKEAKRIDKAVLNVMPDKNSFINGILFEVDDNELELLKQREAEYSLQEVPVHCFLTNKKLCTAFMFVGRQEHITYFVHPDPVYYRLCHEGAASFGEEFLKEWDEMTFHASGRKVSEVIIRNGLYDTR